MRLGSRVLTALCGIGTIALAAGYVYRYVIASETDRAETTLVRLVFGASFLFVLGAAQLIYGLQPSGHLRTAVLMACAVTSLVAGLFGSLAWDPLALVQWWLGFPALMGAGLAAADTRPYGRSVLAMLAGVGAGAVALVIVLTVAAALST